MNAVSVDAVSGGWLALCTCGWERFDARRPALDLALSKHTCPQPKRAKSQPKSGRATGTWNAREDSTWIDKL